MASRPIAKQFQRGDGHGVFRLGAAEPEPDELAALVAAAPPMTGGEYLTRQATDDLCPPGRLAQNCAMNFQASGGMKAFEPSSPVEVPSSTLDGVCGPSNVHTLTG